MSRSQNVGTAGEVFYCRIRFDLLPSWVVKQMTEIEKAIEINGLPR